jgi:hypothetical protein
MLNDQDLVRAMRQRRAEEPHKAVLLKPAVRHDELVAVAKARWKFVLLGVVVFAVWVAAAVLGGRL